MSRPVLLGVCVLAGCASAGSDTGGGNNAADASASLDAPTPLIDAAIADAPPIDPPPMDAPLATCTGADTCQTATMLGTVSGDSGNIRLNGSGYQSAWYRVRVTEDDSDIFGLSLRVGATVTSSANAAFDVFIYVNTGSDTIECSTTTGTKSVSGNVRQVRAEWGEGTFSNGSDDGRTVSIEVRPLATSGCSAADTWQLEVEGNWL
jgi:hypothetical protein